MVRIRLLQQRVHELPVSERDIGHDLSEMGVICRAEFVFDVHQHQASGQSLAGPGLLVSHARKRYHELVCGRLGVALLLGTLVESRSGF